MNKSRLRHRSPPFCDIVRGRRRISYAVGGGGGGANGTRAVCLYWSIIFSVFLPFTAIMLVRVARVSNCTYAGARMRNDLGEK